MYRCSHIDVFLFNKRQKDALYVFLYQLLLHAPTRAALQNSVIVIFVVPQPQLERCLFYMNSNQVVSTFVVLVALGKVLNFGVQTQFIQLLISYRDIIHLKVKLNAILIVKLTTSIQNLLLTCRSPRVFEVFFETEMQPIPARWIFKLHYNTLFLEIDEVGATWTKKVVAISSRKMLVKILVARVLT